MSLIVNHKEGIIGAAIFAVIVIVLLLLLGFTIPFPLPAEEAILVEFAGGGNIDAGLASGGSKESYNSDYIPDNGYNTQDNEEAPSLPASVTPNENRETTTTIVTPTPQPKNRLEERTGKNNGGSLSGGNGSGTGGIGTGGGNPGYGTSGSGGGSGNAPGGSGGSIEGRKRDIYVAPEKKPNTFGTVILEITVDSQGNVIDPISVKSSNCQSCVDLAIAAVRKWKYQKIENSTWQKGNVTITFAQE
ncbi:MAG: energy transducer TonB [Bacteroidales bacterium]|jgi:TonB family protein|nr:energy transducer TonB [Bacteroidales bacterium]